MDWQSSVGDKLTTPEEAVRSVKSGDRVGVAPFTCTPFTLCDSLYARGGELQDVHIDHAAGLFAWRRTDEENGF
ncbi:MAG TPA: hypothetical protein VGR43_09075, partial [Dehalococcoidia bacterium]|nr:hypothetical protein [Dehalococcoidia bacterium]